MVTAAKAASVVVIAFGIYLFSEGASWSHLASPAQASQWSGFAAFGAAMLASLWAYNGWNNLPMIAGEVRDPARNIPLGLITGMGVIIVLYLLVNSGLFYALPFGEILTSNSTTYPDALPVASKAAQTFLGPVGTGFVTIAFLVSVMGALNGTVLMMSRVPFAMAGDGLFFGRIAQVSSRYRVPVWALAIQAVWAGVLALSGTFDQLTDFAIFGMWIFYGLTAASVFVLRRKVPEAPRPYRVLDYPVVPFLFVLVAAWLILNTIYTRPLESTVGLGLIGLGLPVYFYFSRLLR